MNREEAIKIVEQHIKSESLLKHVLAVEAIMKKVAEFLGEDKEKWGLVGLLHDIDFDEIEHPKYHGLVACEILKGKVGEDVLQAIKSHNFENTNAQPSTKMEYCLIAADAVSGLVVATGLIVPSRKLNDVKLETLKKKYKQKDFARNCRRENMMYCEKAGISLDQLLELSLKALQEISDKLGL